MAKLNPAQFTNAGLNAAADLFAHQKANKVSHVSISTTNYLNTDISQLTKLAGEVLIVPPSNMLQNGNVYTVTGVFDSTRLTTDVVVNSIGVYIIDNTNTEVLLAVVTATAPDTIPAGGSSNQSSFVYDINIAVTNSGVTFQLTIDDNAIAQVSDINSLKAYLDQKLSALSTASQVLQQGMPVGSLYFSMAPANPSTFLGFGTWTAVAAGRVLVGVSPTDTDFSAGKAGGEKAHVITVNEEPSHYHNVSGATANAGSHNHHLAGDTWSTGGHGHSYTQYRFDQNYVTAGGNMIVQTNRYQDQTWWTGGVGDHSHHMDFWTDGVGDHSHTFNVNSSSAGGGAAHNNLQPYLVCYIWQRTA